MAGALNGTNGDDQYLAVVLHLGVADGEQRASGDTTDANAQLRALAHYGVSARLVQNAYFQLIEQQIARGVPVPCGYLHRGPVDRPDLLGEPDLIHGTTLNANGMGLRFSRQNYSYAGLRLWQARDGGADRRRCLRHDVHASRAEEINEFGVRPEGFGRFGAGGGRQWLPGPKWMAQA